MDNYEEMQALREGESLAEDNKGVEIMTQETDLKTMAQIAICVKYAAGDLDYPKALNGLADLGFSPKEAFNILDAYLEDAP